MTSKDIASKKFEKAKGFGGYKIDDVEDFMDRVAEYVEQLENEKRDMEKKLCRACPDKLEEYRADEDSLRTALLGAQKLGDSVIKESKTKAEIILRDANIKAEKIIGDAHLKADEEQQPAGEHQAPRFPSSRRTSLPCTADIWRPSSAPFRKWM